MKKTLSAMALLGLISACSDLNFSGHLNALTNILITEKYDQAACNDRFDWWNCKDKSLEISRGAHTAEFNLSQSGTDKIIQLKLDGNSSQTIKIVGNKNVNIGDNFFIRAADISQNFDISGTVVTQVTRTGEYSAVERCSVTHYERQCHWSNAVVLTAQGVAFGPMPGTPGDGGGRPMPSPQQPMPPSNPYPPQQPMPQPPPPRWVCEDVPVTYYGDQDVRYYNQTTLKTLNAKFLQSTTVLGDFSGQNSNTEKIYTYQGVCRL